MYCFDNDCIKCSLYIDGSIIKLNKSIDQLTNIEYILINRIKDISNSILFNNNYINN